MTTSSKPSDDQGHALAPNDDEQDCESDQAIHFDLPNLQSSVIGELNTKAHYEILDGLRGVAALMVVAFHIMQAYTLEDPFEQAINHGYLAVDFFFVLSGFVIGFAYDDRWDKMTIADFLKRRVIRLHPLVVMSMILGAVFFYSSRSAMFPLIHTVPVWKMLVYMLLGMLLIPVPPSVDIRGWDEMYTLNTPVWTLFYEYIAYISYALFIRKLPKRVLAILVVLAGCATIHLTVTNGDVIGGWSFNARHLRFGFTRLVYPFLAGLLLHRIDKLIQVKHAFLTCSFLMIVALALPRIGGKEHVWMNWLYESFCIIILFPFIVFLGAGGKIADKYTSGLCKFFGDISFPLYITHSPLTYVYIGWISDTHYGFWRASLGTLLLLGLNFAVASACLKLCGEPVRDWLRKRLESK